MPDGGEGVQVAGAAPDLAGLPASLCDRALVEVVEVDAITLDEGIQRNRNPVVCEAHVIVGRVVHDVG